MPQTLDGAVPDPDPDMAEAARERLRSLGKPAGSLGRLEGLSVWAAAVQGRCPPRPFQRARVVVFAGDHGIAEAGVSTSPAGFTASAVADCLAGAAAVNVLARATGATVRVVDMAVDADTPAEVSAYKVRRGSGRIDREDALTVEEVHDAFDAGTRIADEEVDGGADLLIAGDVGAGSSTAASTVVAALTGTEPVHIIGSAAPSTDTGIDDDTWMRKLSAIRDALRRVRGRVGFPALLQIAGGADIAAISGFVAQAAIRRTPVLLDGLVPVTAALVAREVTPAAVQWWLAAQSSAEPAHAIALERLGLDPLLDLGMRHGEGAGALVALPLLDAAVRLLAELPAGAQT
ncbi:MAG: nicotinate-nucleotide--dimethylbenzimidazole phosphoribosyltransferase [Pseudonocardiales bacterium]|nr:MAG: nicotinate-nucleotide--dimethylbenzimidazole phosphoribosyltransferase [Pseudonocardiales bacterium]